MTALRRTVSSHSVEETLDLGRRLAAAALPGDVVALVGELGSGKTHFAKGLAEGLGAARARDVVSPTFVLCREYPDGRIPFYHLDAYRLSGSADLEAIGCREIFAGGGLSAVEWADRAPEAMPEEYLEIRFEVTGQTDRTLTFIPHGPRAEAMIAAVVTSPP